MEADFDVENFGKKIGRKFCYGPPLPEKIGKKTQKTPKMAFFDPKMPFIGPKLFYIHFFGEGKNSFPKIKLKLWAKMLIYAQNSSK